MRILILMLLVPYMCFADGLPWDMKCKFTLGGESFSEYEISDIDDSRSNYVKTNKVDVKMELSKEFDLNYGTFLYGRIIVGEEFFYSENAQKYGKQAGRIELELNF